MTTYTNAHAFTALTDLTSDSELVACDIEVVDGVIQAVRPASTSDTGASAIDLEGRIVFPGFVDCHTHLDKAFTWDRAPNLRGEFWDAIKLLGKDKENWTEEDLYKRGTFALRCAEAHGTVALRTHVDCGEDFGEVSHQVMARLKEEWKGRIELQTVSLCGVESYPTPHAKRIADMSLISPGSYLGGMPQMNPQLDAQLDALFHLAAERGVGVDLHVDENGNPDAECLRHVAQAVLRTKFPFSVTCGHVCSLAVQDADRAASTIDLVAEAGIRIVSLPMCNLYLQGRPVESGLRGTPRWRGVTLLHELVAAGVTTACASDNVRDAFYAWGDFDMFEVFNESVRIAHLDTIIGAAGQMVTSAAAKLMDLDAYGAIRPGNDGRLIAFEARSINELLSRPAQKRELLGFAAQPTVPGYAELQL
jgi:cytosine deaminase